MPKQTRLNAFDMNCVGHRSPGLWIHPRDRAEATAPLVQPAAPKTNSPLNCASDLECKIAGAGWSALLVGMGPPAANAPTLTTAR